MEELGINIRSRIVSLDKNISILDRLEPVCKYLCRVPNETEMTMLFKARSDGPFKLHPQEITQGKFFTRKELSKLVRQGKIKLSFMGKVALAKLGWL